MSLFNDNVYIPKIDPKKNKLIKNNKQNIRVFKKLKFYMEKSQCKNVNVKASRSRVVILRLERIDCEI